MLGWFSAEAACASREGIPGDFVRQEFQRYKTVQASVFTLVDHSHAPAAELFHNAVVGNGLADQ